MPTDTTYDGVASWNELCPDGANRWYEGDDPEGFAKEMMELFGLDVRAPFPEGFESSLGWDSLVDGEPSRHFHIPAGLAGEVYGSERWPLGS
jgi:hypothetical protein